MATKIGNLGVTFPDNTVQTTAAASSASAKAWVNFDGTGTVAIRASFNVSSITDNGAGDYTVNFTTALADADYALLGTGQYDDSTVNPIIKVSGPISPTTTAARIQSTNSGTSGVSDALRVSVSVFR